MNLIKKLFSFHYYTSILAGTQDYRPFLAAFILALVLSARPSFYIFKDVYPLAQNLESKVLTLVDEVYPLELEIKIKNGTASTNVTEPYFITIRQETLENLFALKADDQSTRSRVRLLAIDTKGKADDFERYQSLALLTESSIVYYNDDKVNIYPLREVQDLTLDQKIIKEKIRQINKNNIIGNIASIGILLAPFLILLAILIFQLIAFLFLTLVVYLMVRINQLKTGFKNIFRYTAAIAFITTLIWNLILLIPLLAANIPISESILTIIILGFAYSGINYLKTQKPAA